MYIYYFNIYLYFAFFMFIYSYVYYQKIVINHIPYDLCINIRSVCVFACLCIRRRCSQHLAEKPLHVREINLISLSAKIRDDNPNAVHSIVASLDAKEIEDFIATYLLSILDDSVLSSFVRIRL